MAQRVPAAEVAASGLMNRQVGWVELNCINTNSLTAVGAEAATVTDWCKERNHSDFQLDCLLLFVQVWI